MSKMSEGIREVVVEFKAILQKRKEDDQKLVRMKQELESFKKEMREDEDGEEGFEDVGLEGEEDDEHEEGTEEGQEDIKGSKVGFTGEDKDDEDLRVSKVGNGNEICDTKGTTVGAVVRQNREVKEKVKEEEEEKMEWKEDILEDVPTCYSDEGGGVHGSYLFLVFLGSSLKRKERLRKGSAGGYGERRGSGRGPQVDVALVEGLGLVTLEASMACSQLGW